MTSEIRQRMTGSHIRGPLAQIAGMIATVRQRARDRAALSHMDDRDLRDMRLSRGAVAYELNKPFWRA